MGLPENKYRARLTSMGFNLRPMRQPKRNGKVIADEYWFYDGPEEPPNSQLRHKLAGVLTIWRPDSGHYNHDLSVFGKVDIARHTSTDPEWLLQLLDYCKRFVAPKIDNIPPKESKRQADNLVRRWVQSNPPPTTRPVRQEAKEFIKSLQPPIEVHALKGTEHWVFRNAGIEVVGGSIVDAWMRGAPTFDDAREDMVRLVRGLVNKLRTEGKSRLGQLDHWTPGRETATRVVHAALSQACVQGELEQSDSRGDWNFFEVTGVAQPQEEGAAKDFLKSKPVVRCYVRRFSSAYILSSYWSNEGWTYDKDRAVTLNLAELTPETIPDKANVIEIVGADGEMIAAGALSPDNLDYWKTRFVPGHVAKLRGKLGPPRAIRNEGQEPTPLFPELRASFAPGTAKSFVKAQADTRYTKGENIESGRSFRRLVGQYPAQGVYIWGKTHSEGRIVVVLSMPQGFGNPRKEWPIQQNWASFDILAYSLRTWRNLQGADLFINGVPAGKVAYRNPALQ